MRGAELCALTATALLYFWGSNRVSVLFLVERVKEAGGGGPAHPACDLRPPGIGVSVALFRCFSYGPRLHFVR